MNLTAFFLFWSTCNVLKRLICKIKKIPLGLGKSLFGVDLSSDFGSVGFSLDGTSSTVTTSSVVFRKTEAPAARNPLEAKANRKLLCAILQLSENVVKKSKHFKLLA